MGMSVIRAATAVAGLAGLLALAACSDTLAPSEDPNAPQPGASDHNYDQPTGSVFGSGGLDFFDMFGSSKKNKGGAGGGGIGVNSFLWRASLDTISFMPLASADPFGGVIITDWYQPPETPNERFKMNVYILGRELRADGVRVAVFRQSHKGEAWVDAPVTGDTKTKIENEILTRARQLRFAARADANN